MEGREASFRFQLSLQLRQRGEERDGGGQEEHWEEHGGECVLEGRGERRDIYLCYGGSVRQL